MYSTYGKLVSSNVTIASASEESVEKTVELITEQLEPKQEIQSKTMAKQFVSLLIAPSPLALYGMTMSFYTELGFNLMDRANFVSMRMYYNFRMIDRMYYKDSIG